MFSPKKPHGLLHQILEAEAYPNWSQFFSQPKKGTGEYIRGDQSKRFFFERLQGHTQVCRPLRESPGKPSRTTDANLDFNKLIYIHYSKNWKAPLPDPLNIMMRVYNRNITFIHKTHFFCAVSAKHELYAPKWNRPCNVVMGWWAGYGGEVWFWTSVSLSYFFLQACTCVSLSEVECGLEKLRQISITFRSRPD